jgi:hypothetical protein
MRICLARPVSSLIFSSIFATCAFSSPMSSKLLFLVPAGCEIVAGFENRHDPGRTGHLLLSTHNNRVDLDDWQALAGADSKRVFDEIIEAAASPAGGDLVDHLLLVAGRFDKERIFKSAQLNGAQLVDYQGETILLVKPFAREQEEMLDTRWLAILDNRTAILGTSRLVQDALRRYTTHALPDPILEERVEQLRGDVTSWNVLVTKPKATPNITFAKAHALWSHLLEDTEVFLVGAHFGDKVRVDFSISGGDERGTAYLTQKASMFTDVFAQEPQPLQPKLENFSVEPNRVEGSISLSGDQFKVWSTQMVHIQARRGPAPPAVTDGN